MEVDKVQLANRLIEWAHNEEMVDQYYTDHGKDCLLVAKVLLELVVDE